MQHSFPHNAQAEKAIIGSILLDPDTLRELELQPEHFFKQEHVQIFNGLRELDMMNQPADLVTLTAHLETKGTLQNIGGVAHLVEIVNETPGAANIRYYERIVMDRWREREALRAADMFRKSIEEGENLDTVMQTQVAKLLNLSRDEKDDDGSLSDSLVEIYDDLEKNVGEMTGIETGYTELNKITTGFQLQDLIIIAARPSMGKTAFCLNVAYHAAGNTDDGDIVAIFSLEMAKKQLVKRFLSIAGNIDATNLRTGNLSPKEWGSLTTSMGEINQKNFKIYDKPGATVNYIWNKVQKLTKENPDRRILVIIDYLQLIQGNAAHKGNRQAEIAEISRTLKTMARELNVCVCALSQLSRGVESRQDKHPMMSDIRESGQIEQDADVIGFLYRDDYYDKESEKKNIIEIIIAKQRNGPTGTVELAFIKEYGKFLNLERRYEENGVNQS